MDIVLDEQLFLTPRQFGVFVGLSADGVTRLVGLGKIPGVKISPRKLLIPRSAVDELLASARAQSEPCALVGA